MNTKFFLSLAVILILGVLFIQTPNGKLGSVLPGGEYTATTTDATWSTATTQCKDTLTGKFTLGNIIVTKTSNATLFVYDATTTGPHSNHATTTLVAMPLTTVGEYTFDVSAQRGLCVVVDTTVGVASTTITFR